MLRLRLALVLLTLLAALHIGPSDLAAAPSPAPCTYTVRSGDTLGAIASRYNTSVGALVAANGLDNPNLIRVGQPLIIPECGAAPPPAAPPPAAPPPVLRIESIDTTPDPKDIAKPLLDRAVGATINIVVDTIFGFTSGGTGTVVGGDGRTFLTAFHVVGDPDLGILYPAREIRVGPYKDWALRARVVAVDPAHDLAVLRVDEADDFGGFAYVPLGDTDALQLGDTIYTLSYPGAARGGLVTTKGTLLATIGSSRGDRALYFLTDAGASAGSSGGVAINERGEVIGIVSAVVFRPETLARLGLPQVNRATVIVPINWGQPLLAEAATR